MDRPPQTEWETSTFTSKPANEFDEHWVAIDVPKARALINDMIDVFNANRWSGLVELS